jgi:hypothetical protein
MGNVSNTQQNNNGNNGTAVNTGSTPNNSAVLSPVLPNNSNNQQTNTQQQPLTLEDQLNEHRNKWTTEITSLNEMMKTLPKVNDLLGIVYMKRQEAVDYYHSMNTVILKQMREYKRQSLNMFNTIKISGYNGVRLPNDSAIQKVVEVELIDEKSIIDLLTNHNNFIKESIATIDNLIYGINQKIKLGEILNGLKF